MIRVRYSDDVETSSVCEWLEANCQGNCYVGTDWENWIFNELNQCVQFEDEKDAMLFMLRWS
jgi:hypothetical protein